MARQLLVHMICYSEKNMFKIKPILEQEIKKIGFCDGLRAPLVAQLVKNPSGMQESACNAGDLGSIPGSRRCPGEGNGDPLQYSCLKNPTDRGAWRATVHGVTKVRHDLATKPPPWWLSTLGRILPKGIHIFHFLGFPGGVSGKEPACQCRRYKRHGFNPWVRKIPWRRKWQPTPVFLPGESHGQRSLVDYSP